MDFFRSLLIKFVLPFVLAVFILGSIRYFVQPITVSTGSMAPTLELGEHLIIERLYVLLRRPIQRFDLVAIVPPYVDGRSFASNNSIASVAGNLTGLPILPQDPMFVRRVIALPGEKVELRKGLGVLVDGKLLEETIFTSSKPARDIAAQKDITLVGADGKTIQPLGADDQPLVVPPGSFFVLPDNRNSFEGSDMWGFVGSKRILGRVSHRYGQWFIRPVATPKVTWAGEKVALNDQGVRCLEARQFNRAISLFNQALAIDEKYDTARDNLSIAYNNYAIDLQDKPEAAIDKLHKALYIDPENQLTRKNLNKMIESAGKNPASYEDRLVMAREASKQGRTLDALVEYREASRVRPESTPEDPIVLRQIEVLSQKASFPRELTSKLSSRKTEEKEAANATPK